MAISAPGVGSGIDVNSIVSQLMALERQPLNLLTKKVSSYNSQLSAYGQVKSELAAFQSAAYSLSSSTGFSVFTATASDTTVLNASASSTASVGAYNITVGTMAASQQLISNATTLPLTDSNTTAVGTGTLTIASGAKSFAVTIDGTNNTLDGIASAINSNVNNFGMTASVMFDGTNYRLLMSANNTGVANAMTVSVADSDGNNLDTLGLSRLSYTAGGFNLTQSQAAADAALNVNGVAVTSASNTVTSVINGVTLNLTKLGTTNLTVASDTTAITAKVNNFISAYNKLHTDMANLHMKGGALEADNTLLSIQAQLDSVFNTPATIAGNAYNYLAQVGVSRQKDGSLALDTTAFTSALSSNFNNVVALFSDPTQGFGQRLNTEATNLLQTNGLITSTTDGINTSISSLTTQQDQMNTRLILTEQRLRKQYASLDALLGSMNQMSQYLVQNLAKL
jgi:flagellar hook-associated protein 2